METRNAQSETAKTVRKLCLLVVGMFGFGFALVPLYDLLCEVTGLGGRTGGPYTYDPAVVEVDRSRLVKVNLLTNTNDGHLPPFELVAVLSVVVAESQPWGPGRREGAVALRFDIPRVIVLVLVLG